MVFFSPFLRRAVIASRQAVLGWLPCTLRGGGCCSQWVLPALLCLQRVFTLLRYSRDASWLSCLLARLPMPSSTGDISYPIPAAWWSRAKVSTDCRTPCCACTSAQLRCWSRFPDTGNYLQPAAVSELPLSLCGRGPFCILERLF